MQNERRFPQSLDLPPSTDHKAHASGIVTAVSALAMTLLARFTAIEPPEVSVVTEAVQYLVTTVAMYGAGYAVAWLVPNKRKA